MKFKFILPIFALISVTLLLSAYGNSLTPEGAKVREVNWNQKDKYPCKLMKLISSSYGASWIVSQNQEYALIDARNKVAEVGGNAFLFYSTSSGELFDPTVSYNVEALNCSFSD
jgi:hypothetical protein